ncbi:MAG: autotransporter-associated beta strand repeat-containing protein [Pirellulales bacterium]|nr:autotransporter-associated beta strand repeat-containing protein [Pirellulales bacterium]
MRRNFWMVCFLAGCLAFFALGSPLLAATFTWDGNGGNDLISNGLNWGGDSAPGADQDLVFPGGLDVGASVHPTMDAAFSALNINFDTGAPAYNLDSAGFNLTVTGTAANGLLINNSSSQMVINATNGYGSTNLIWNRGVISAAGGDLVINAGINIGNGSTSGTRLINLAGSHNIYFNVDTSINAAGSLSGGTWVSTSGALYSNTRSRLWMDTLAGTAFMGDIGTSYRGTFHLSSTFNGALRLTNGNSLGDQGATSGNYAVVIYGGTDGNATMELDGSASGGLLSTGRRLIWVDGRSGAVADDPHIRNVSGVNTYSVWGDWNTGYRTGAASGANSGNINIQSDSGNGGPGGTPNKLTLAGGPIYNTQPQNLATPWTLNLGGDGDGEVQSPLCNYIEATNPSFIIVKKGAGTWTLNSAKFTATNVTPHSGPIIVQSGTLALGYYEAITRSASIDVKSGATFDVSVISGWTLPIADFGDTVFTGLTLMGKGTVKGDIYAATGTSPASTSKINPGESGSDRGALTFLGNLTLVDGTIVNYDLSNNPLGTNDRIQLGDGSTVAGLNLSGTTTLAINMTDGALGNGSYHLFDYTGSLSGAMSNFSLSGVGSGTTRQTINLVDHSAGKYISLDVTGSPESFKWAGGLGSNIWDKGSLGTNNWTSSNQKFYDLDTVTFDGTGNNALPINVSTAVNPAAVIFSNPSGHDYSFAGTGSLLVNGAVTQSGSGNIALNNTGGVTVLNGLTQSGTGSMIISNASGDVALSGPIALGGGGITFNQGGTATASLNGDLTGAGPIVHQGSSVVTLGGDNTAYAGGITVKTGAILKAGSASALGATTAGTTIESGGTLDVNGFVLGAEPILVSGAGVGGAGAIVNTSATNSDLTLSSVTLQGNTTFGAATGYWEITGAGSLAGGGHQLTKVGGNIVWITNAGETDLGDIDIQEGTLLFYGTSTVGQTASKTISLSNGGILGLNATPTVQKSITVASSNGGIWLRNGNSAIDAVITMNGNLAVEIGSSDVLTEIQTASIAGVSTATLTLTGGNATSRLILASDNNVYGPGPGSPATIVNSGVLQVGNGGTTGALPGGDIVMNGGALRFLVDKTYTVSQNILGGTGTGAVEYGPATTTGDTPNAVVTVTGNNTYYGNTTIWHAKVILQSATGLGDASGITNIRSNSSDSSTGQLVLDGAAAGGALTLYENFTTSGYGGDGKGIILNQSGNNVLTGGITLASGGGHTAISVQGGTLDLQGTIAPNTTLRVLVLGGNGDNGAANDGTVSGIIANGSATNVLQVAKLDSGKWTFSNSNTYTGQTTVEGGTLAIVNTNDSAIANMTSAFLFYGENIATLDTTAASSGGYYQMGWDYNQSQTQIAQALYGHGTVAGGIKTNNMATISPSGPYFAAGTMNISGNLTLLGGDGITSDKLLFKLGSAGNDKIVVGGALAASNTANPTLVEVVPNGILAAGTYDVVHAGSQSAPNSAYFALDPTGIQSQSRQTFGVVNTTAGSVNVSVSGNVADLTWNGSSPTWDVKAATSWDGEADHQFWQGDKVTFGDAGAANLAVDLTVAVYPGSITVNPSSAATAYVIGGAGKIGGGTGITVNGGSLAVNNTGGNDFAGAVVVNAGAKLILGSASALGTTDGGTTINGGTLDLNGQDVSGEQISIGANGAIVNSSTTDSTLQFVTFTGNATFGGLEYWDMTSTGSTPVLNGNGFALTKIDANDVELNDLGETHLGNINLTAGIMYFGGSTTLGDQPGTLRISNNATLGVWLPSTVTHSKAIVIESTGGQFDAYSDTSTFSSNITLDGDLIVLARTGAVMNLNGPVLAGTGTHGMTKNGAGKLVLGGVNTYQGPTLNTAGTLELTASGQISTGSAITNDAVFQIDGGTHALGTIGGTGAMYVLGTSNVTAASITQNSLQIGGAAPVVAASAAVPEPSAWLLLLAAGACVLFLKRRLS